MKGRHVVLLLSLAAQAVLGAIMAKGAADSAALTAAGFRESAGVSPDAYVGTCAREGAQPAEVTRCMPTGAVVEWFVSPTGGRDSVLLQRYVYRAWGIGRWPVQIYYVRGGGVVAVYAQDSWPGLDGARPVSAAEAERWRTFPDVSRAAAELERQAAHP